jgi:hypothetical protein
MSLTKIPVVAANWQSGLQALKSGDRKYVTCSKPHSIQGSIDLDAAYLASQPQAPRWDYGVEVQHGQTTCLALIEPHPASSSGNVQEVCAKAAWIDEVLKSYGIKLPMRKWWINTGKVSSMIALSSRQLAQRGVTGPVRTTSDIADPNTFGLI